MKIICFEPEEGEHLHGGPKTKTTVSKINRTKITTRHPLKAVCTSILSTVILSGPPNSPFRGIPLRIPMMMFRSQDLSSTMEEMPAMATIVLLTIIDLFLTGTRKRMTRDPANRTTKSIG